MGRTPSKKSEPVGETKAAIIADDLDAQDKPTRQGTPHVRRAMLKAAADLFAERGFGGTNLADVAAALGMSRPGLYYHFSSKEKLLEALIEEVTGSADQLINSLMAKAEENPEDALRHVLFELVMWVLDNHVLFRVLDRAEVDIPIDLRRKHDLAKKSILGHFTRIIERGVSMGRFRPIDPHIAALAIIGMRNWTAWWYNPEGRIPKHEVAETIADMAVRSLLRPDAHRSRSNRIKDALRVLEEDVAHLANILHE